MKKLYKVPTSIEKESLCFDPIITDDFIIYITDGQSIIIKHGKFIKDVLPPPEVILKWYGCDQCGITRSEHAEKCKKDNIECKYWWLINAFYYQNIRVNGSILCSHLTFCSEQCRVNFLTSFLFVS